MEITLYKWPSDDHMQDTYFTCIFLCVYLSKLFVIYISKCCFALLIIYDQTNTTPFAYLSF